jgi:predicted amidohydrolase YtcJ
VIQTADVLVVSDCVATMAPGVEPGPGFVAIAGNRILAVGARQEAEQFTGPETRVIDAGSKLVMPGMIDVHAHFEVAARVTHETVDCRAPRCQTIEDVQAVLRENLPDEGWLVGQANLFFDRKLKEGRLPTRAELDAVSVDVPIALRAGGHITVLNTKALEVAGIDRDYQPPTHSVTGIPIIEREPDGAPSGVVREFDNLLPLPNPQGEDLEVALSDGARELFTRYGVTTVGEITETVDGLKAMEALHRRGELGVRVHAYVWAPGTMSLDQACNWQEILPEPANPDLFRVHGVKLFADGGYSAASAYVKRPYVSTCSCGTLALSSEQVDTALAKTRAAGLQLAVHANGDLAQESVCAAIEAAGGAPEGALRTRVEHAGNFLPEYEETTDAWRRAGIIPVPQPIFLYTFGDFFPDYLGEYGAQGRFPFRRLLDDGWPITGSSDVWIGSEMGATNPFMSIWCSVERRSYNEQVLDADQAITLLEALHMHTLAAAAVLGQEDVKGSLENGKLADVVVLDRNPFERPGDELPEVRAEVVILDGRVIYEAPVGVEEGRP